MNPGNISLTGNLALFDSEGHSLDVSSQDGNRFIAVALSQTRQLFTVIPVIPTGDFDISR